MIKNGQQVDPTPYLNGENTNTIPVAEKKDSIMDAIDAKFKENETYKKIRNREKKMLGVVTNNNTVINGGTTLSVSQEKTIDKPILIEKQYYVA
jgi:hypothetical protein